MPRDVLLDQDYRHVGFALQRADRLKQVLEQLGARPIDGSSIIRHRGCDNSVRPIETICCWPPDRKPARLS